MDIVEIINIITVAIDVIDINIGYKVRDVFSKKCTYHLSTVRCKWHALLTQNFAFQPYNLLTSYPLTFPHA